MVLTGAADVRTTCRRRAARTGCGMADAEVAQEQGAGRPTGSLAPVALGLGIAGVVIGLVPFYGLFMAVPMSVVGLVLGLVARSRPWESRRQATGGIVAGGLGLLVTLVWVGTFAGNMLGIGEMSSESSMEVGTAMDVEAADEPPGDEVTDTAPGEPDDGPTEVVPGDRGSALREGLSGDAELELGDRAESMRLEECALTAAPSPDLLVRGQGPDGRMAVAAGRGGMERRVVLSLELDGAAPATYVGEVLSAGSTRRGDGGPFGGGHQLELEGELQDLHSGETVDIHLTVTCS